MFDHMLEASLEDNSSKWSNVGFGEEITHECRLKLNLCILSEALGVVFLQAGHHPGGDQPSEEEDAPGRSLRQVSAHPAWLHCKPSL